MAALDKVKFTQNVVKDYLRAIKKNPNSTPKQLLSMIYLGRRAWFNSLYPNDLEYFNAALKKLNSELDIDPMWEVSVSNQQKASKVFNNFIQQMKGISLGYRRDTEMTNATLDEEFEKIFGKHGPRSIAIGNRILKELTKLGYRF